MRTWGGDDPCGGVQGSRSGGSRALGSYVDASGSGSDESGAWRWGRGVVVSWGAGEPGAGASFRGKEGEVGR